ncbi:MAG: ATP-binding protein [Halobacterium sp.]
MNEADVLRTLSRMNTWWGGDEVPGSLLKAQHRRLDFFHLYGRIHDERQVLTIRGPRQVGKTTVVGQLIHNLLGQPLVSPEHVLYVNAENTQLLPEIDGLIENSIEAYEGNILGQSIRDVDSRIYVFIDEIQKIPDWAETVKYYTDTFRNLKFVVTGSISTLIQDDASESLVGRLDEYLLMPMKFAEYARYHDAFTKEEITDDAHGIREALKTSVKNGDASDFTNRLAGFYGRFGETEPKLRALSNEYLLKGGYPDVLNEEYVDAFAVLDSNLRNTVRGDIPSVFDVRKPDVLIELLNLAAHSSGQKYSVQTLHESLSVGRETVEKYLDYLEEFFLIGRVARYSSGAYGGRGRKKIYIPDTGLLNTLNSNLVESTLDNPDAMGQILETACFDLCKRLQFHLSDYQSAQVAYWDEPGEVDFVLSTPSYCLPVEVKNGDPTTRELRGMRAVLEKTPAEFGVVVNRAGVLEQESVSSGEVVYVPAWLFFTFC